MSPTHGVRPACIKRALISQHDGPSDVKVFHACWLHAHKLENDTLDVPGWVAAEGSYPHPLHPSERDDAGVWCSFCI